MCTCVERLWEKCNSHTESSCTKEIWRYRLNWFFLSVLGGLYAVSYTSITSSFHQFITNPSEDQLNGTNSVMQGGLGQTEVFYSMLISLFNIGALVGAIVSGFLIKFIPYWYLIMFSLLAHTIGYIMYAVTYIGWLIMISKFLSGLYIGAELTLALSYFAESSIEYNDIKSDSNQKGSSKLRNMLFAFHNLGINIGYIVGPGFAVVLAQFKVDQFRSIAWYNVALGIGAMILQLVLFRGESSCKKFSSTKNSCCSQPSKESLRIKPSEILILIFLIILRGVLSFRFGAYETVYNPVLADYFGFDERESSYFFFSLSVAQIIGTLLLIFFQKIKLNSQTIAIIGLLMTIGSCVIMADWQAIPYDECTEYSPFHHPDIVKEYTLSELPNRLHKRTDCHQTPSDVLSSFELTPTSTLTLSTGQSVEFQLIDEVKFNCQSTNTCEQLCSQEIAQNKLTCLHYDMIFDPDQCWSHIENVQLYNSGLHMTSSFMCAVSVSSLSFCIMLDIKNKSNERANTQDKHHLKFDVYQAAKDTCIHANGTKNDCYWIPQSIITGKHCDDCEPICRSRSLSLTFTQFIMGSALLLVSIPIAWVPVAALISNRVSTGLQGIVMGFMVALTAIGRSVSPIWLDAAYEGLEKRTFLAMILLATTHLPFLIGIMFLYKRLQKEPNYNNGYSRLDTEQSDP